MSGGDSGLWTTDCRKVGGHFTTKVTKNTKGCEIRISKPELRNNIECPNLKGSKQGRDRAAGRAAALRAPAGWFGRYHAKAAKEAKGAEGETISNIQHGTPNVQGQEKRGATVGTEVTAGAVLHGRVGLPVER